MNNKTKKILAGLALGCVGATTLAGCAITEDQQKSLDLITEKADEIINLLENNMTLTNSKLSKEEACEKILLAISKFKIGMMDQVHVSEIEQEYDGVFDILVRDRKFDAYFRKSGDQKVLVKLTDNEIDKIKISDFKEDEHYEWEKGQEDLQERIYNHQDFMISNLDISGEAGIDEITPDDIYDIVVNEDSYAFKVFYNSNVETGLIEIIVSKTGYLQQINYTGLELDHESTGPGTYNTYNSYITTVKYEYENIDFSDIDTKLSQLQE